MPNFKFKILTGTDAQCQQKYDAILTKDAYTFYLFQSGRGYFNGNLLFGGDEKLVRIVNSNLTSVEPHCIYFVTSNITIQDASTSGNETKSAPAGSIWIANNLDPATVTEISRTVFGTYIASYIANSAIQSTDIDSNYTADNNTIMTAGAVAELISREINSQSILEIQFLKRVAPVVVTLTSADITAGNVAITFNDATGSGTFTKTATLSANDHEGDIGLGFIFQVGTDYDDSDPTANDYDGDTAIFVNLHGLIDKYVADPAALTTVTTIAANSSDASGHSQKIKTEVNKSTKTAAQFETIVLDAIHDVIAAGQTYDPEDAQGDNLSPNKFISESQLAGILAQTLFHFAEAIIGSGDSIIDDQEEF